MKIDILVADPCWSFNDKLEQSSVKRGAAANYDVLSNKDIINLPVKDVVADNSLCALWVPSALLKEGIQTLESWGFKLKQTHIWVKSKKNPLEDIKVSVKSAKTIKELVLAIKDSLRAFDLNNVLYFGMGHWFRQSHEIVLIGVRGKFHDNLKNRSQRSVHFAPIGKHSAKPETLQDMLDLMFPDQKLNKVEFFARRDRKNWRCFGNECPSSFGEDIRDSIERLKNE